MAHTGKYSFERFISLLLALALLFQLTACGIADTAKKTADTVANAAVDAKNSVVTWWDSIDLTGFKDGWDSAIGFVGTAYSTAMSSSYVAGIETAITNMKIDMNAAYGSARGVAQEAGFAAEKWAAGTFNITAAARESSYQATVEGSNKLGSVDVSTNYGENASLKYYSSSEGSARAQAAITDQASKLIQEYAEYSHNETANGNSRAMSMKEYMDAKGYDPASEDALIESMYSGQTRIIPTDQLTEATAYLEGRISRLSAIDGDIASENTRIYQETLANLKDRLTAPDGTTSKPLTQQEAKAIAELAKEGKFDPKDFGITVSQVIDPVYVVKQAVGTGLEVGLLKAVLTVGPDIVSIIAEGVKTGAIDENALKNTGIEGTIAMGEGFVEGSVSRIVVTLCESGALGETLKGVSSNIIGALVFLTIEAMISGYSLAKGEITAKEYGCLIADRTMITALAMPTSALLLSILPGTKLFMLIGCLAGGIIASVGYTSGKEAVLEFADGGGFEAIVPVGVANRIDVIKDTIASLNLSSELSNLQEYAVTTFNTGVIKVKELIPNVNK